MKLTDINSDAMIIGMILFALGVAFGLLEINRADAKNKDPWKGAVALLIGSGFGFTCVVLGRLIQQLDQLLARLPAPPAH